MRRLRARTIGTSADALCSHRWGGCPIGRRDFLCAIAGRYRGAVRSKQGSAPASSRVAPAARHWLLLPRGRRRPGSAAASRASKRSATSTDGQAELMHPLRRGNEAHRPGQGGFGSSSKKTIRCGCPSSGQYPRCSGPPERPATGGRVGYAHARLCGGRAKPACPGGHTGGDRGFLKEVGTPFPRGSHAALRSERRGLVHALGYCGCTANPLI